MQIHISGKDTLDGFRRKYMLLGTVLAHEKTVLGYWPFKKRISILKVRLEENDLRSFNETMRQLGVARVADEIEMGFPEATKALDFPVGAKVMITFGFANALILHLHGGEPLKVTDITTV
jgi:hypothetical protein